MYLFSIFISFCLWQLSFGSEYSDTTLFTFGNSEFTSSAFREKLRDPFIEVKPLLSEDSILYIESILSDINSTVTYDHEAHFRNIFENFTDEEKLLKLSNFFLKLLGYVELSVYDQFCKENYPNSRLHNFESKKCSQSSIKACRWVRSIILVINFTLLKHRLGSTKSINDQIFNISMDSTARADCRVKLTRLLINLVMDEVGELRGCEKEAFRKLLLFQKDFIKLSFACIKEAFKPTPKEIIGISEVRIPYKIDGIIDSYQLSDRQLSFGNEFNDLTPFDLGYSEFTSSKFREMLKDPFIEVKPLLSEDSILYIESILSDINSTVTYDHEAHFRNIFENFTDEEKLLKLSNFLLKLSGYVELSLYEQFCKESYPNSRLRDFEFKKCSLSSVKASEWVRSIILVINFTLLKQRLGSVKLINDQIFRIIMNLKAPVNCEVETTRLLLLRFVIIVGGELRWWEKEAFKKLLLFQKDSIKLSFDCIKVALKPTPRELVGILYARLPYKIDGIIDSYQLDDYIDTTKFGLGNSDLTSSAFREMLRDPFIKVKPLLSEDSISYIDSILSDINSTVTYNHETHFRNIFEYLTLEELLRLSNFFLKLLGYVELSLYEQFCKENYPNSRLSNFEFKKCSQSSSKTCEWVHSILIVINFTLLKQRLGSIKPINDQIFRIITNLKATFDRGVENTRFLLHFVINVRGELRWWEKEAFRKLLLFQKDSIKLSFDCIKEAFKPTPRELVGISYVRLLYKIDGIIDSYLLGDWKLSFGGDFIDTTSFELGNSEITSSALREMLKDPFIEVKPLLSEDSIFYIDSILSDIKSTVTYDHETHFRNIFENFTDEEKLLKLSNFFFKLLRYIALSLYEQFHKENYPNSRLSYFDFKKCPQSSVKASEWVRSVILVINFTLLKQRLGATKSINDQIFKIIMNLKAPVDRGVKLTRSLINFVIDEVGELRGWEKEAFRKLLLFQKDFIKLSFDCIKVAFKPTPKELIGIRYVRLPYKIDGIIDSYQLDG